MENVDRLHTLFERHRADIAALTAQRAATAAQPRTSSGATVRPTVAEIDGRLIEIATDITAAIDRLRHDISNAVEQRFSAAQVEKLNAALAEARGLLGETKT
jgi:hypothetical protein